MQPGLDEKRPEGDPEGKCGVAGAAEVIPVAGEEFELLPRDEVGETDPSVVRVRREFERNVLEFQFRLTDRRLVHIPPRFLQGFRA